MMVVCSTCRYARINDHKVNCNLHGKLFKNRKEAQEFSDRCGDWRITTQDGQGFGSDEIKQLKE